MYKERSPDAFKSWDASISVNQTRVGLKSAEVEGYKDAMIYKF